MKVFAYDDTRRINIQKNIEPSDSMIFRRARQQYEKSEDYKLVNIQLAYKNIKSLRLPRYTKTILPNKNLNKIVNYQKLNSLLTSLLSLLIICGSIYEVETFHQNGSSLKANTNIIRLTMSGLAATQLLLILVYYKNHLLVKKSFKIISKHSLLYHDLETLRMLIIEIALVLVIIPPFIEYAINIYQLGILQSLYINDIVIGLIFLRVFHFYKLYYEFSYFNSLKARFFCDLETVPFILKFTMKCFLKENPWYSILFIFSLSTVLCGILLFVFERSVSESPFSYIWDSFWVVSYTESTIGYGDKAAKTHLGRSVLVLSSFIGLFMYSYIVLIVRNSSDLSNKELKLYSEIKYLHLGLRKLKSEGIILIQRWWRLFLKRRIKTNKIDDVFKFQRQLKVYSSKRLKEIQGKNPTLSEEVKKISKGFSIKLTRINEHLKEVDKCSDLAHRFANKCFSVKKKIEKVCEGFENYGVKSIHIEKRSLYAISPSRRISAASSKAEVKKLRKRAVKKLITEKLKKNSITISINGSGSSDDEFYSSNNSRSSLAYN